MKWNDTVISVLSHSIYNLLNKSRRYFYIRIFVAFKIDLRKLSHTVSTHYIKRVPLFQLLLVFFSVSLFLSLLVSLFFLSFNFPARTTPVDHVLFPHRALAYEFLQMTHQKCVSYREHRCCCVESGAIVILQMLGINNSFYTEIEDFLDFNDLMNVISLLNGWRSLNLCADVGTSSWRE